MKAVEGKTFSTMNNSIEIRLLKAASIEDVLKAYELYFVFTGNYRFKSSDVNCCCPREG